MVEAHRLVRRYGARLAVDDVSFAVPRGAVVGVLGPNGAGKTTTIRMLVGCLRPTSGSVVVDGVDLARDPRTARQRIGYLPEQNPLYNELRVDEQLRFHGRLHGLRGDTLRRALEREVARCGLGSVRRRLVGALSKGYRQRVGLAAALLHEPPVVVLDEPTSGLDPTQVAEFRALLAELSGRHTVLLSSHVLAEVDAACDRLIMIRGGTVVAEGTRAEVRRRAGGGRRIVVEISGSLVAAERALADAAPGPHRLQRLDARTVRAEIGCDDQDDAALRERIALRCAAEGVLLRELSLREPSLEELFRALVAASNGAGAVAGAEAASG